MNLFVIPSWYPCKTLPLSGIFTREQVEALASLASDIRVIVSTWGYEDFFLPVRRPWKAVPALVRFATTKRDSVREHGRIAEISNPALSWHHRLPFGGAARLLRANRRNFRLARSRYGRIDLIHAHVSYPAGYIAQVLQQEFGVPYVLTEHMGPFPFPSLLRDGRPIVEIATALKDARRVVAVSPALASRIESLGFPAPNVIPNLVDERRFVPGMPQSDRFIFFTLCSLTAAKGVDQLLKAIALWDPPASKVEFWIGGDGASKREFQELARRLGIADRVRWLGSVSREQAPEVFRATHAYVMPSMHESFGIVYAEALASGKPVIATRCGGPESIVHDTNGRLVDVGDTAGLAEALAWMRDNWPQFDAESIRSDFEQRFSRQVVVRQLEHMYQSVLGS